MKTLAFTFVLLASGTHAALKAGVARVDITPPPGIAMWGYSARAGVSTGTRDPLYARVLVPDDGLTAIALVALILGAPSASRGWTGCANVCALLVWPTSSFPPRTLTLGQ